jgi:glycosyltransferase involved in cell wall biosynthesis
MRLLQVMLSPRDGGAETFFEKLAVEFHDRGWEQQLVICRHEAREGRLRNAGCRVKAIAAQGLAKWLAPNAVNRIQAGYGPDFQLAWMSRAAGALSKVPGVVNLARLGGYYSLNYYKTCDHLIANTPGVVSYLVSEGWPEKKISMISNFGEIPDCGGARDLREELKIPEGAKVILGLGRLHANKAHDVSLSVLQRLKDCVLLIVGSGPLKSRLADLAEELGVAERVRFLGWRRDIENLYATADLVLFPSRSEPLGNVVLEAWAFGVPLVAAASEGPAWLVEDGENGMLFPVDSVSAAASAVQNLLEDGVLARRLVNAGRAKLAAEFSRDAIVMQYEELFSRLKP